MWKMIWDHKITSLFQMEKQSGISGIEILKPTSVDDLAILNSTIRLMAQEKGGEMPTEKLTRFKENPQNWDNELKRYGLNEKHKKILEPILGMSYGLCIAQEQFMELVQLPELGGFSLTWADKLRKSIAKKNPKEYEALTKEFYKVTDEKKIEHNFAYYVWAVLIAMSRGYGFNQSHTLAYSLIGLQEMNLAYRFPIIFWNCACLISETGGNQNVEDEDEEVEEKDYFNEMEELDEDEENEVVSFYDEEDCDGYPVEVVTLKNGKKKKKVKATNYGKVAAAIGKMQTEGIKITPPDINNSVFTFSPDVKNNSIIHGLTGITRISEDLINEIIAHRPYASIFDFMDKVKVNKTQMINLIKCGAFDCFGNREDIMNNYIENIADTKKVLNLRNAQMLIREGLIPQEQFDFNIRVFNFNKYLKNFKIEDNFGLNDIAFNFYSQHFDIDLLKDSDNEEFLYYISQKQWKKLYDGAMLPIKKYIISEQDNLLREVNSRAVREVVEKYAEGTISKWEMDSLSYYTHEHELAKVNLSSYEFSDFFNLPNEPIVSTTFKTKDGKEVPIFKLHRIIGTVLDRDKNKNTVTLLTTKGVVMVKIFGEVFSHYDKQISVKDLDGKKHVIEKSWFKRGEKIIVTGIKRDNNFIAKKYSRTPFHIVEKIEAVAADGSITIKRERETA